MGEWKRLGCAHANLGVLANPNPWDFHHSLSSLRIILQYEISSWEGFSSFKITLVVKNPSMEYYTPEV